MKKTSFIAVVFIAATAITGNLYAQENARPDQKIKTKSNIKNDKVSVVVVSSTSTGCSITIADRDVATGMATGKRMHKPYVITKELDISSTDNTVTEAISPRDISTGQASGKASFSDISFTILVKGKSIALTSEKGEFEIPADCPNGDCKMVASWSWGQQNGGSSKRCDKTFTLTMENGVCKGINQSGIK